MPKVSEKKSLQGQIRKLIFENVLKRSLFFFESEEWILYEEQLQLLTSILVNLENTRFLYAKTLVPKTMGLRNLLFQLPEHSFKQMVRMNQDTFIFIEQKVKECSINHIDYQS